MSNAKHTAGPWTLGKFGCVTGGPFHKYANGEAQAQIASATVGDGITPEEREANANLIAAAPELFDALVDLCGNVPLEFVTKQALTAIAKAKGEK